MDINNEVNLTIIVPVYNTAPKILQRCIQSIKKQTYDRWKAIIINDGSDRLDTLRCIYDECMQDKRFEICNTNNCGVANARNFGIKKTKTEFLLFCDADDELNLDFLSEAINFLEMHQLDVVIGCISLKDDNNIQPCMFNIQETAKILDKNEKEKLLKYAIESKSNENFMGDTKIGYVFSKIYQTELVKNIMFDTEMKIHEDNIFSFNLLYNAHSIGIINRNFYVYWHNKNSLTRILPSVDNITQEIQYKNKILKLMKEMPQKYMHSWGIRIFRIFNAIIWDMLYVSMNRQEMERILESFLYEENVKYLMQESLEAGFVVLSKQEILLSFLLKKTDIQKSIKLIILYIQIRKKFTLN